MLDQIEIFDIESPCKRVCETNKQGYCMTCFRSRDERFGWLKFTNEQKRVVLRHCRQRALRRHYHSLQESQHAQVLETADQLDLFGETEE